MADHPSKLVSSQNPICLELLWALGIKVPRNQLERFCIRFDPADLVKVTVVCCLTEEDVETITRKFKNYHLKAIPEVNDD